MQFHEVIKMSENIKVLAINSSPHKDKGNTAMILSPFMDGMKKAGADMELYYINDLNINPCMGDHACQFKSPGQCVQKDDMNWLLQKFKQADIWVWATPLYGSGMTGTLKILLDRMLPIAQASMEIRDGRLRHPPQNMGKNKKVVLVSTCGFPEIENFDPIIAHIKEKCANSSLEFSGALLRPAGPAMASMKKKGIPFNGIFDAATDAGQQLIQNNLMSKETLNIISKPIISKEAMLQIVNKNVQDTLKKIN